MLFDLWHLKHILRSISQILRQVFCLLFGLWGRGSQNFHKLITLWLPMWSIGRVQHTKPRPKTKDSSELGERHFNWIREVNRQRKSGKMGMGSSWQTAISKNPPHRRYSIYLLTYAEPAERVCIFVSLYLWQV